jgi:uncharacterized protein (TIGR00255 family)
MTGFGMAEGDVAGRRATVEIRTVNHRHFNLSARLPSELGVLEAELREGLRKHFDRGHLSVTVRWTDEAIGAPRIDWAKAEAAVAALRELRDRFHLAGDVTVELIARQADLFARGDEGATVPWSALAPVVDAAASACVAARRREGAVLTAELLARLDAIEAGADRVAALAPARIERERERLLANVTRLMGGASPDPQRIAQEIALAADRLDITEELVRLRAHLADGRATLATEQPVGKRLGFLAQELGREVNTIGSKANDAAIAHLVLGMKGELEKIREQLENLE